MRGVSPRSLPSRLSPRGTRAAALLAILIGTIPCIAQSLPPAQPTSQSQTAALARSAQPSVAAHRAIVDYTANKLSITADNSSLNQILRDIARLTGMTITGGVLDERVFGSYGPADTSTVLTALLNGTGSNMLLISSAGESPQQLILTPRQGGPTPPSPSTLRDPGEADLPPQLNPRTSRQFPAPPPQPAFNGALPAAPSLPVEAPAPAAAQTANPAPAAAPADTPTLPPANATTEESPNGVKTPQQIYDQLIKLQQQQAKPPQQP